MFIEKLRAKGTVTLELRDKDGNLKTTITKNLIVDTGLVFIASRMKDAAAGVMTHIGIGSSNVAAAPADIALGTELARVALDSTSIATTNVPNDSIQYVATFGAGIGTGAVVEAGIFDAPAGGNMLARTVFGVVTKTATDVFTVTWKIAIS